MSDIVEKLGLGDKLAGLADEVLDIQTGVAAPAEDSSPYFFELDEWDKNKGEGLQDEYSALQRPELSPEDVADFHAAWFLPDPIPSSSCEDAKKADFLQKLLETPDYKSLHELTQLDFSAEIAAVKLATQYAKLVQQQEQCEKRGERDSKKKGGKGDKEAAAAQMQQEMQQLRAIGKAISEARTEVEEIKETQAAFGCGPGQGGTQDTNRIVALFQKVRRSPTLRRIAELAGRYRRFAQSCQRQKTIHGNDDVVGVALGNDVAALLPEELASLNNPLLKLDAMRRFVDRQMMQLDYNGIEPQAKGPVVFVVDESGSMQGEKNHMAKAMALAMAWIAKKQNRWCCLISFSGGQPGRVLPLIPGKWDEIALCDWLDHFIGQGTELDVPLRELPRWASLHKFPVGKTDIVFVTDGIVSLNEQVKRDFLRFKKERKVKAISLIIGAEPGPMVEISDSTHVVRSLDISESGVKSALSI